MLKRLNNSRHNHWRQREFGHMKCTSLGLLILPDAPYSTVAQWRSNSAVPRRKRHHHLDSKYICSESNQRRHHRHYWLKPVTYGLSHASNNTALANSKQVDTKSNWSELEKITHANYSLLCMHTSISGTCVCYSNVCT